MGVIASKLGALRRLIPHRNCYSKSLDLKLKRHLPEMITQRYLGLELNLSSMSRDIRTAAILRLCKVKHCGFPTILTLDIGFSAFKRYINISNTQG